MAEPRDVRIRVSALARPVVCRPQQFDACRIIWLRCIFS